MSLKAEHQSVEGFLRNTLTAEARRNVLFVSFTQWDFALAALADTASCLNNMGADVTLAFWANKTPMHDTGWSVNDKVAKIFGSPARDQLVRDALIDFGIPKSSLAQPPVKGWKPAQPVIITRAMNRSEIKALTYFGSPMGRAMLQVRTLTETPVTDAYLWPERLLRLAARSYAFAYDQTTALIKERGVTAVAVYNGRFLHDRAASAAAQALGIPVLYYDTGGIDTDFDLTDSVTHDWSDLQRRMLKLYEEWPADQRDVVGASWFQERLNHTASDNSLFTDAQEIGSTIDRPDADCLVVYFSSSGDEIAELELDWDQFIGTQPEALKMLADECRKRPGYQLVVRSHPHKRRKPKQDVIEWITAVDEANPDIHLDPHSPIDSYALMRQADIVVTYGSTTGVEAAFAGKRVIVLGPSAYDQLECATLAGTQAELSAALDDRNAGAWAGAVSYGLMMRARGFSFEFVKRDPQGKFTLGGKAFADSKRIVRHLSNLQDRLQRWAIS